MKIIVLPVSAWRRRDLVLHVAADERVERAERLVVEHHVRVDGEGAGDADALLHSPRELVGELVGDVLEPDEREHLARPCVPVGLAHAADLEPERDVVEHAPVREQAEVLEDHRDGVTPKLPELGPARLHHVAAGDFDLARRRLDEPDQRADERRLAGTGKAHHDEHLARPDFDRDVPYRRDAAGLLEELAPRELGLRRTDDAVGLRAEDLPDATCADERSPARFHALDAGHAAQNGHQATGIR